MKKGDTIELEVIKYSFEGKGIAKIDNKLISPELKNPTEQHKTNYVVFVNGAYPGDIVKAKLRKIKKSFAESQ